MERFARATIVTAFALACAISTMLPSAAFADMADGLNRIRQRGCDRKMGVNTPLRASRGLDAVAREWSQGGKLHDAIRRTDYRIINSSSMRVEGVAPDATLLSVLEQKYCEIILDPQFTEIGVYQNRGGVWVVVAAPFVAPRAKDASRISARVLQLVNEARAKPRKCGRTSHPPAGPLTLSATLSRAALTHAKDMGANEFFEHQGSDGSRPSDRATRAGYRWRTVAENIALGAPDAESVVRGWLGSPGHCANIMNPQFTQMGLAYVVEERPENAVYWVQVFGLPR